MKVIILNIIILFGLGVVGAKSQNVLPATGGEASGSGGTASYTVGQAFYISSVSSNGSVAEGVQQPYVISDISGINNAEGITLSVSAYPNPTSGSLTLRVEGYQRESLIYYLYNLDGKLLESNRVVNNCTTIHLSNFPQSMYLIRILDGQKEIKTFKIIKN